MRPVGGQHHRCFRLVLYRIERASAVSFHSDRIDALVRPSASSQFLQSVDDFLLVEIDRLRTDRSRHGKAFRNAVDCDHLLGAEHLGAPNAELGNGPQPQIATVSSGSMSQLSAAIYPWGRYRRETGPARPSGRSAP
jgi:hypothetical protein